MVVALMVPAVGATSAFGTTGQITEALASPDWMRGSFAGTVEWSGCAHPVPPPSGPSSSYTACTWTAYATVGPGTSEEACLSPDRQLNSLGAGVQLVWQGEARTEAGSESFAVADFPMDGAAGKVLCLAATEVGTDGKTIPCLPPGEPIPPGWHCPYHQVTYFSSLGSSMVAGPGSVVPQDSAVPAHACFCPTPSPRRGHRVKHRHRRIWLSPHQKVSVS